VRRKWQVELVIGKMANVVIVKPDVHRPRSSVAGVKSIKRCQNTGDV
jgi:hypothetical protein